MLSRAFRNGLLLRQLCAAPAKRSVTSLTLRTHQARHSSVTLRYAVGQPRFLSSGASAPAIDHSTPEPRESPSLMRFGDLGDLGVHQNLIRSVTQGMRYDSMTEVQDKTIRSALAGKDLVAQAKTGTGKTLAFLLPLLQRMINEDERLAHRSSVRLAKCDDIRGIILSPTRELAEQIAVEAKAVVAGTGLVVQSAVGGTRKQEMLQRTRREGCHLLVATPGRLNDLLSDPTSGIRAPNLAALVLDEADRMLDVGFADEIASIQRNLPSLREKERQTLLFSATIPPNVVHLARSMVRHDQFEFVQTIGPDENPTHEKIPQKIIVANGWLNVFPTLYELMHRSMDAAANNPGAMPFKALVYFPTTSLVEFANAIDAGMMRAAGSRGGLPVFSIHGKLTQSARTRASESFRRAKSGILLSSDVTARGMDFPNVSHVIQVGLPSSADQYIHRLGRTGRQDKSGEGWLIVTRSDLRDARSMLRSLKIQPDDSLACAAYDPQQSGSDPPPHIAQLAEACKQVRPGTVSAAYRAFFGKMSRQEAPDVVADLNQWITVGCGWPNPPTVSPTLVSRLGLRGVPGLNIGHDDFDSERGPSHSRSRHGRGSEGRSGSSSDFDSMFRNRRDDFGGRGGSGRREGYERREGFGSRQRFDGPPRRRPSF